MAAVLIYSPLIGEAFESGDKLYAYVTSTSTPVTLYQDDDLNTAHATPVVADATGRFDPIYADATGGDLKITVTDSNDVERFTSDPFIVSDITTLTTDLATLNTTVTSINGRLTTAESEIDTLQTESADYESRINSLEGATSPLVEGDFTGANQSLSTNGYQVIPGGFTHQWGKSASPGAVTFPLEFPNYCRSITATLETTASNAVSDQEIRVYSVTKTGFSWRLINSSGANGDIYWQAVGY
jgi:hypothetical protein